MNSWVIVFLERSQFPTCNYLGPAAADMKYVWPPSLASTWKRQKRCKRREVSG